MAILHPLVAKTLSEAGIRHEILECDPADADTGPFCARYGYPSDEVCNTIVVVVKKTPREYVACLVRADTKLDVNHSVAAEVGFKRLSFASSEEPSWNRTPCRRVQIHSVKSALGSHFSANDGSTASPPTS